MACGIARWDMRKFLIPLVFVVLLTVAAVMPAVASTPDDAPAHSVPGCSGKI